MKKIEIDLSSKSVQNALNEIRAIKKKLVKIDEEFLLVSLEWIKNTANLYLAENSEYSNTTDIKDRWEIYKKPSAFGVRYELRNTSPFSALVEFGTGAIGGQNPHELASLLNYQYGNQSWTFVRDLESMEWVVNTSIYGKVDFDDGRYLFLKDFEGYEGKSYLYDAFFDYFHKGHYKEIYKKIYKKYLG